MAKARILVEGEEEESIRKQAEDLAQLNEDEGGEIFRAIDELRGVQGTMVVIVKLTPSDEAGFCDNLPVAEFSHEELKKRFGAGLYKVRVRGPKGWIPGGGNVRISPVGIEKSKSGGTSDIAAFLELMEKRDAARQSEKNDKMNRLTELGIPALTTIVAALISRNTAPDMTGLITALKGPSALELMTALQGMNASKAPSSDPIDQLIRVAEVVQKLGPGNGDSKEGGSNWVDVLRDLVKEAVPAVKPMLENLAENQRMALQQRQQQSPLQIQPIPNRAIAVNPIVIPQPGSPTPATTSTSGNGSVDSVTERAQPGDDDMMSLFLPMIRQQLTKVTQWAINDWNPQTYAEVFMNELPQLVANYINPAQALEYLNRPDWFERVVEFHAMLKPYHDWCNEFREELILLVTEQLEEATKGEQDLKRAMKEPQPQILEEFKDGE